MSEWCAGFAAPWVEWDGVEGEAGRVHIDGVRVPTVDVWCDSAGPDHATWHDHCIPRGGSEPIGFGWAMPLENRLWAIGLVDEHSSIIHLDTDPRRVRCPVDLSLAGSPPSAWLCPNNWKDECPVDGHRSWDMGDAEGWAVFDSHGSLMRQVRAWSALTVNVGEGPGSSGGRGPRPVRRRQLNEVARRVSRGTVTSGEYNMGIRPAWWSES